MKPPLSHHCAVALAEMARAFPRLHWVALAFLLGFAAAAIYWGIWWLWILAALTVCDVVVLFVGKGFREVLDADPDDVANLRRKYSW